jgi:hypothetical protein
MARNINAHVSSSMYCQACGAANPVQATRCFACDEPLSTLTGGTGTTTNPLTGLLLPEVIMQQRYRILEMLSTGEVSTVYKAEDTRLGNRLVTLKEIGKNNADTPEAVALIAASRREMLLLAGLIHPNLPRIYDYFVENQRWYFVMDFLAGETLEAYLSKRKNRPLAIEEVLDSGIQLATVLDYLHLHKSPLGFKDLTLSTIWRTPDGKLYLLDTGTAPPAAAMPASRSIYSLGRILRQLQTGKKSVRALLLHVALPGPRRRSRHPQETLKVLIRQMVHRNARKRPYMMGIIKRELQQQELQLLATQHTPTSTPKQRRFSRRTLFKLGGLAGLAAASGTLVGLAESQILRIPHPGYSPNLGGTICTYYTGSGVLGVAWSPNGMRLAMGNLNGQVQAFDANTGLHVMTFQAPDLWQRVEDVIWLPDGKTIAAGGDNNLVWVWNAATGQLQRTYRGHTSWVIALASSPDSKYIASGGQDTTVQVWEAATGRQVVIYRGHSGGIGSVAWSPDGNYIASASYDKTVQIWEAATGRPIYTYHGHINQVYTVAWSPDGGRIASGDAGGTVLVWPVALFEGDGQHPVVTYNQQIGVVQTVTWSPDSRYLASVSQDVEIWNSFTGKHIYTYTGHKSSIATAVQAVAWSPNGRYIASGGIEGTVQVWNAR